MTRKGRTLKEIRDSQERKPKLIFQLYANSNLQKELNIEIFFSIWWSHSIYDTHTHTHTHTQMNHLAFFFFFLIQKSCAGDRAPSCWYRSWMESSGMAQCRCQNQSKAAEFWEDPPNTENLCCTQMVSWISICMRRASYWCPPESRLRPVLPKRSNCVAT